ncbi:hypothetical protein [Leucobacter japonicus]|uniref:hypothetical protein n=1 Tax=Leucobacter japonicus TaxID=1461259 RepID=UPI0006A7AB16|nr:hypothetical protein [Leucobacter japonicus]
MSDKFVASNGIRVKRTIHGSVEFGMGGNVQAKSAMALREFFQHERDQELGRWRWPENPDYVVYPTGEDSACAVDERSRDSSVQTRDLVRLREQLEGMSGGVHGALVAFFAAHPEPKPWHDAKPGEVWEFTYVQMGGGDITRVFTVDSLKQFRNTNGVRVDVAYQVLSARRIWPVVSDVQ